MHRVVKELELKSKNGKKKCTSDIVNHWDTPHTMFRCHYLGTLMSVAMQYHRMLLRFSYVMKLGKLVEVTGGILRRDHGIYSLIVNIVCNLL